MAELNILKISQATLFLSNLLRKTSLKKKVEWNFFSHQTYAVKNGINLTCDVYVPKTTGLKPAVLVVHGGGWSSRTREDTRFYSEQLAGQGFVVVNCTYRLAPDHIYPSAVEDIRDAYHWMIKEAKKFEIDKNHIGAMGYSAGAHLISLIVAWASQQREGYADVHIKAAVLGGGVYDFMVYPLSPYINRFTTFYRDQNVELYRNASPLHQLGPKLPSFFLFHSKKDELVEHDQMVRFAKNIEEKGASVEVFTVPRLSHVHTFVFSISALEKAIKMLQRVLQ
jgi:acetyl esterase/lipase